MDAKPEDLRMLAQVLARTHEDELGCDECFELLDRFVETELAGLDAAAAMPLVEDHLRKCGDCREEFELLLEVLKATDDTSGLWLPVRRFWTRMRRIFSSG